MNNKHRSTSYSPEARSDRLEAVTERLAELHYAEPEMLSRLEATFPQLRQLRNYLTRRNAAKTAADIGDLPELEKDLRTVEHHSYQPLQAPEIAVEANVPAIEALPLQLIEPETVIQPAAAAEEDARQQQIAAARAGVTAANSADTNPRPIIKPTDTGDDYALAA